MILPAIRPITFCSVRTIAFTAPAGKRASEMPVTTAGGRSAAAIATPAIPSGIPSERAIIVAKPRRTAIRMNTALGSVRDRISGVRVRSMTKERANEATAAIKTSISTISPRISTQRTVVFTSPTAT